ncbi:MULTISPECIES: hypothetical protein [unclassified Streptomyces]|nr:hypothetical protein OG199_28655 [Streptomyces sp. NBC_01176]
MAAVTAVTAAAIVTVVRRGMRRTGCRPPPCPPQLFPCADT